MPDDNPLDILKGDEPEPRLMKQGAVTYRNVGAHHAKTVRRKPMQAAKAPKYIQIEREPFDPHKDMARYPDGTLTHPNGKKRVD